MADNLIRWKRGDYVRLSKAINRFNKQVNELQAQGIDYTPDVKSYQSIKENIYTRKELNRIVNSLKKFSIETAKKVELPSGEKLTSWEYRDLRLARNRARKILEGKLEIQQRENPYGKFGIETKDIENTKATLRSLNKLESKTGYDLKMLMRRINKLGSSDTQLKKAITYKDNYMKVLNNMENYENWDLLKEKLDSIKDSKEFYEYIKQSPVLSDLFKFADSENKSDPMAQTYGGFANNQEAFNTGLKQLGLLEEADMTDLSDQVVHIL